jgi:hypothetical protein
VTAGLGGQGSAAAGDGGVRAGQGREGRRGADLDAAAGLGCERGAELHCGRGEPAVGAVQLALRVENNRVENAVRMGAYTQCRHDSKL